MQAIIGRKLVKCLAECLSVHQLLRWTLVVFAIPLVSRPVKAGKC